MLILEALICKIFGHKVPVYGIWGCYCARCEVWLDYGAIEPLIKQINDGVSAKIPKVSNITDKDILINRGAIK